MDIHLTTERLVLHWLGPGDVDDLVELDSDPEVMRYLTNGKPTTRETVERTLYDGCDREAGYGRWAATEKATGAFVGWFALSRDAETPPDEGELGYRLRRDAWGKGYATEGSRAVLHKAFTELGTRRVWAETMFVNTRSRQVMERVGLRFVRVFHLHFDDPIPGTEHGEVEYEILREEWEGGRP
ncbi:GNAT family N-acetyltransferase [Virgisporangium ochraceum]|uniref:GNAT family acetyltransferase n=1 Tax=Virgisporangium ochraceum TaxID=65505 RepID=A0A8J4EBW9_9ACTN|nr:GNAT family N-acetyltransferase [Virgisporangium ochraceum]GIJ69116.1 GNAT family acetyltransferase [Virgisporangium ochraceum]